MLRDYEQSGSADRERAIRQYLKEKDSERVTIENKFSNKYVTLALINKNAPVAISTTGVFCLLQVV